MNLRDNQSNKAFSYDLAQRVGNQTGLSNVYENWQEDIIKLIARKLAQQNIEDDEILFGIFSAGFSACTLEDFKYVCLKRLNLNQHIDETDLDRFLNVHAKLKGKNSITQKEFSQIFSKAIEEARKDAPG